MILYRPWVVGRSDIIMQIIVIVILNDKLLHASPNRL